MLERIRKAIMIRRSFRKTYNILNNMSSRELDDIGIDKSQITRIALEQAKKSASK